MTEHTNQPWTAGPKYGDLMTEVIGRYMGRDGARAIALVWTHAYRPTSDQYRSTVPDPKGMANLAFILRACNSHEGLVKALVDLQHGDGCYCEAAFAGPGTVVRHSDECIAACDALEEARPRPASPEG